MIVRMIYLHPKIWINQKRISLSLMFVLMRETKQLWMVITQEGDILLVFVFISQSYFQLPHRSIRNNANTFILFKLISIDINNFWRDNCSVLCSKIEFEEYVKNKTGKYKYIVVKQHEILKDGFQ